MLVTEKLAATATTSVTLMVSAPLIFASAPAAPSKVKVTAPTITLVVL